MVAGNWPWWLIDSGTVVSDSLTRVDSGTCRPPGAGTKIRSSADGSVPTVGAASSTTRYWLTWV